ncbi:MAG: DUF72 domain-containing protein [Ignavibacteriales bacterium]|nr:DUF72 domain-containing protein [Ignavibacteriales bacterium]
MTPEILVGMGGWVLPSFDGRFYPSQTGKGFRKLQYYSRFFDMVEVNATFYTTSLTPKQARQWLTDVAANKRFTFTVKLYQGFTHKFDATQEDAGAIHALLEPLVKAEKLGGLVLQFPYSFMRAKEREQYLLKLGKTFQSYMLFVEFRHDSWNHPDAFRFLKENKFRLINVDLPNIKRHMPMTGEAWGEEAYFRLMGRNKESWDRGGVPERYNYFYSAEELKGFFDRISAVKSSVRKVFVVFHNDPQANSAVNGFQLKHMIDTRKPLQVPEPLMKSFPDLAGIATAIPVASESTPLFTVRRKENSGSS